MLLNAASQPCIDLSLWGDIVASRPSRQPPPQLASRAAAASRWPLQLASRWPLKLAVVHLKLLVASKVRENLVALHRCHITAAQRPKKYILGGNGRVAEGGGQTPHVVRPYRGQSPPPAHKP